MRVVDIYERNHAGVLLRGFRRVIRVVLDTRSCSLSSAMACLCINGQSKGVLVIVPDVFEFYVCYGCWQLRGRNIPSRGCVRL